MEVLNIDNLFYGLPKVAMAYYDNPKTYIKYIIDEEINKGLWHDDILASLRTDSVIVDIGANIGLFSLYIYPKAKCIYAIEPTNDHFKVLQGVSESFTKIQPFRLAIHNWNGFSKLFLDNTNYTGNHISKTGSVDVKTRKLLAFFKENNITQVDLLKMDIEGGEREVILLDDTVDDALKICGRIFIETHLKQEETNLIIEKICGLGFKYFAGVKENSHYFIKG